MLDNVYIYYSGATDKTGNALAEALEIKGGITSPGKDMKIVIGWGAKTKDNIDLGSAIVLNHPNCIRDNRDKLRALEIMRDQNINVAPFVVAEEALDELGKVKAAKISLPVIARTNYHQGGSNFFTCLTRTHVEEVIDIFNNKLKKRGYFQNYVDVKEEFRLHIMNEEVLYSQRKIARSNMKEAHVKDQIDKISRMAEKKGTVLDIETLQFAMEYQGNKIASPDLIIKSNTRGYKFSAIKPENVNKDLATEAINAVKALGLQFGAVDCVLDSVGRPWIIEVNTGPGLEATAFKNYSVAFSKVIKQILSPSKKSAKKKGTKKEIIETTTLDINSEKLRMLADMLDKAENDTEASAVSAVASRMFGNG